MTVAPATRAGAATPLVNAVSATKYRRGGDDETPIWIPVDLGDSETSSLKADAVVGAVSGDDDRAAVKNVTTKDVDGVRLVGLDVGDLAADEYSGSVDLLPDDDEGEVSLKVTVKDWWVWPLAALIGGLIGAFLVQRLTGVWIPRSKLKSRAGAVAKTYTDARQRLVGAPGGGDWNHSTLTDVEETVERLKKEVDDEFRGAYVSVDAKISEALQATIDAADKLVARFGDLADALPALARDLGRLETERPKDLPPFAAANTPAKPVLATKAAAHLEKRELTVAGLVAELEAVGHVAMPRSLGCSASTSTSPPSTVTRWRSSATTPTQATERRWSASRRRSTCYAASGGRRG